MLVRYYCADPLIDNETQQEFGCSKAERFVKGVFTLCSSERPVLSSVILLYYVMRGAQDPFCSYRAKYAFEWSLLNKWIKSYLEIMVVYILTNWKTGGFHFNVCMPLPVLHGHGLFYFNSMVCIN